MSLVQMSVSGAAMILAILAVRAAMVHRLPKKLFILLWEAVILRLAVPFSLPSMFSVYTFANGMLAEQNDAVRQGPVNAAAYLLPQAAQTGSGNGAAAGIQSVPIWTMIWLAGMCICAVFFITAYARCCREFRTSLPLQDQTASAWLERHPLKRTVRLRQSDRISVPLTYGILRPVILLPKDTERIDRRRLKYILMHEYIHICRFDSVRKMLMVSVLCVHWFNPFVWVMYVFFNRDMELACDESVVRRFGVGSRKSYAETLIGMEEYKSGELPLCNSFSQSVVRERIRAIMRTKKLTIGACIAGVLILAVIVVLFATSADGGQPASGAEEEADISDEPEMSDSEENTAGQDTEETYTAAGEPQQSDTRESTTVLSCTIEGTQEEIPATLYVGDGFSIYIPDEGWQIYDDAPVAPEKMSAVYSPEVGLWVEYYEENASDAEARLLSEGYVYDAGGGKLQRQSGEVLTEVRIFSDGSSSWAVCSRRPVTSEGEEGAAVGLDAIAYTFAVVEKPGEVSGQDGAAAGNGEQAALREVMTAFSAAYFNGDAEGIRQYLSQSFSGTPEVYDAPETAGDVEIREIRGLDAVPEDASECGLSLVFVEPGDDSYTYLAADFVKEGDGWKVSSYGLDK